MYIVTATIQDNC